MKELASFTLFWICSTNFYRKYSIMSMKWRRTMKLFVTAGGSMGHINPALAIIDEFKKREKRS